jgi:hypothetical protein
MKNKEINGLQTVPFFSHFERIGGSYIELNGFVLSGTASKLVQTII